MQRTRVADGRIGDVELDCFRVAVAFDVDGAVLRQDRRSAVEDPSNQGLPIVPEFAPVFLGQDVQMREVLITDGRCIGFIVKATNSSPQTARSGPAPAAEYPLQRLDSLATLAGAERSGLPVVSIRRSIAPTAVKIVAALQGQTAHRYVRALQPLGSTNKAREPAGP